MATTRIWRTALALALVALLGPRWGRSQEPPPVGYPPAAARPSEPLGSSAPNEEQIQARIDNLKSNQELSESARAQALEYYQATLTAIREAAVSAKQITDFSKAIGEATAAAETGDAAEPDGAPADEPLPDGSQPLSQLQAGLQQRVALREQARGRLDEINTEQKRRESRRDEIKKLIDAATQRLEEIERQINTPPPETEPLVVTARNTMLAAQRVAAQQEVEALRKEQAFYDAHNPILEAQKRRAVVRLSALVSQTDAWQELVNDRRMKDVAEQVKFAHQQLQEVADEHRALAEESFAIAQRRQELADEIHAAQQQAEDTARLLAALKTQFSQDQTKVVELSEMTEAFGTLLRKRRQELPNLRKRRREMLDRQKQLREARGWQLRYEEELREAERRVLRPTLDRMDVLLERLRVRLDQWQPQLAHALADQLETLRHKDQLRLQNPDDPELAIDRLLAEYRNEASGTIFQLHQPDHQDFRDLLAELDAALRLAHLQETKTANLRALLADFNTYINTFASLDSDDRELIRLIQRYREFIDERVLWIRSTDALSLADFRDAWHAARELTDAGSWRILLVESWRHLLHYPWVMLLVALALGPLYVYGVRLRKIINDLGAKVSSSTCRSFRLTLETVVLTLAISIFWPTVLALVGAWLGTLPATTAADASLLTRWLSAGWLMAAAVYLPLEVWRQMTRPGGLCENHLDVPAGGVRIMRRNLRWLTLVMVPLFGVLAVVAAAAPDRPTWEASLGRITFLAVMCLTAFFLHRLVHPARGAIRDVLAYRRGSLPDRLRRFWYVLFVSIPLALAVLGVAGYQFTAEQLALRLLWTVFLLLVVWLANGLLRRWVLVNRRRLAMEQARERLAQRAQETQAESAAGPSPTPAASAAAVESSGLDLSTIDQQTRRLLNAATAMATILGVWLVWVDVLPALSRLDDWGLWQTSMQRTTLAIPATPGAPDAAEPAPVAETRVEWVSLADLMLSLLVFVTTLIATRNIPGLIELALLQHLPMDRALRFAFTTVTRYIIFVIGIVWVLTNIGITWSKVQWLVAAVGVGLGFGLQEIFANFISGLIILFERKVRTGDIVTVGDVSGLVTDIRMRATTIQDWDCKELVVPNKEFITGRLLNWTLTNTLNRVVIEVRLAYGADVELARQIILDTALAHPEVLREPAPSVVFDGFHESALHLTLRAYLPTLERRLLTINDLHTSIHENLRKAGLEMPFPQRELHVKLNDLSKMTRTLSEGLAPTELHGESGRGNGNGGGKGAGSRPAAKAAQENP